MTSPAVRRFPLSICIPTFNRARYLPALLDSIAAQIDTLAAPWSRASVEVVVSDNGSVDDTDAVIERYRAILPAITYVRAEENMGADRNYLAVAAAAHGDFCWMMGSDDKLEDGALGRVLDATRDWADTAGFSVNMVPYDGDLRERTPKRTEPVACNGDCRIEGAERIFGMFGMYYGYLSGQVIRRDLWDRVCATGEQLSYLNAYVHVLVIGRMLQLLPAWGYVHAPCVGWRGGNDSFLGDGWVRRLEIDIVGYRAVTVALFGTGSPLVADMRDQLAALHNYHQFRHAKLRGESSASLRRAAALLHEHMRASPVYRRKLLPWILMPRWLAHGAYTAYRRFGRPMVRHLMLKRERVRAVR